MQVDEFRDDVDHNYQDWMLEHHMVDKSTYDLYPSVAGLFRTDDWRKHADSDEIWDSMLEGFCAAVENRITDFVETAFKVPVEHMAASVYLDKDETNNVLEAKVFVEYTNHHKYVYEYHFRIDPATYLSDAKLSEWLDQPNFTITRREVRAS